MIASGPFLVDVEWSTAAGSVRYGASDGPDEADEFAGDGDDDLVVWQLARGEAAAAGAQAYLGLPGEVGDRLG